MMTILSRYIAVHLLSGWLLALGVLGSVFGIIGLIEELERTDGGYGVVQVIQFTLLSLPSRLLDLAPVIFLLGTILALSGLGRHRELTIICCSGISLRSLLKAIALPVAALLVVLWLLLEFVTAPLVQSAQQLKATASSEQPNLLPDGGVWSRHGNRFTHLGAMRDGNKPGDISLYQFDEQGRLLLALDAARAQVSPDRRWRFQQVRQKQLRDDELATRLLEEMEIDNLWSPAELPTLSLSSDSIRLSVLRDYIAFLKRNQQAFASHEMSFWQRVTLPLTVAAMVLLATPISADLGSRRSSNFGVNLAFGALVGIFFFLGTQITHALGQMMQASPQLTALLPAFIVLLCSGLLMRRMRW